MDADSPRSDLPGSRPPGSQPPGSQPLGSQPPALQPPGLQPLGSQPPDVPLAGAVGEPMPTRLAPMLAMPAPDPPAGEEWAYEVKWDGVRLLAFVDDGEARLRTRSGRDVTGVFPELQALGPALGNTRAVLDGEVVAFGSIGGPDFELLSHRVHIATPALARRAAAAIPVRYLVFDLLFLDGISTLALAYDERRALLAALADRARLRVPEPLVGTASEVRAATARAGLEGVVAKRRASVYRPGLRSPDWIKVRHVRRASVLVGGWEPGTGRRANRIGALLVGVASETGPRYAGQVGTGFSEASLDRLAALLAPLRRATCPLRDVPAEVGRGAVWTEPEMVAEVEYAAWTSQGRLRHPSYKGLRIDLTPDDTGPID